MTDDRRIEATVRDWLDQQDPPRSSDRVAEAVLATVPSVGQDSVSGVGRLVARSWRPALVAASVAIAVVLGSLLWLPDGNPAASPSPSATRPFITPSPRPTLPPGVTPIDMGIATWGLTVDERSVWVQVGDVGYQRIDRLTNTDTGIYVGEVPAMAFAGEDLWALDIGTGIIRVDPMTGEILETLPGISGYYLAVDGTTAWVTDVGHSLDRIDLTTGEVVTTIDVPDGPKEIAVFDGSVWVACDGGGMVARIDIATNAVVAEIRAGVRPVNLAAGEGAVWVWNHNPELWRIDPASNEVVAKIPDVAQTLGVGVAVGGGFVWVAVPDGIGKVDPATNEIVDLIDLGRGEYVDIAWFNGELWVASVDQNLVYRIDAMRD
jgi:hypothetical protein